MSLLGFTAEVSLDRTREFYQASRSSNQNERGIYPAQIQTIPFSKIPIDFSQPFPEPQCFEICLRSWGGDCRLICF
jgi:hypothetical protein